ncbi:MAG: hypothetical protein AAGJ37_08395 [Pseudomonadota bacterium]
MNLTTVSHRSFVLNGVRSIYWVLGTLIIVFACASFITQMSLLEIMALVKKHFGVTFISIYVLLVSIGLYATQRLWRNDVQKAYWSEVGLQTANGISTLALTFTLFGISMGIGSLSDQPLSPENVERIISALTAQFSIAFMTTVVGLPTAALFRAVISVRLAKNAIREDKNGENTYVG